MNTLRQEYRGYKLILEPLDQCLADPSYWSYLGIIVFPNFTDQREIKFNSDRVYWDKLLPEDMFAILESEVDDLEDN